MDDSQRSFLDDLLAVPGPSGHEVEVQRVWTEYVAEFADDVRTDAYGNAVATYRGSDDPDATELAFAGHADEIGFVVAKIEDDGFLRVEPVGGMDNTVTEGAPVDVHTEDGPVSGVIGQTAVHLRGRGGDDEAADVTEQRVDVGAEDGDHARELVSVGDPATPAVPTRELAGTRLSARALDNRAGLWVAAEALRRAAERGVDCTIHAVSTVQEELGTKGAEMVAFDLDPDAAVVVDVTHAADNPTYPGDRASEVALGDGPTVARGAANHPNVVRAVLDAADADGLDVQVETDGLRTGTDADTLYTQRGGIPTLMLGVPNRYMHTPVEVVDTADVVGAAELLAAFADREADRESFAVDL
ncbi:M20/M25/M40 family metallo-hydrolase [Halobacterium litoreum]|uniref:M20/M25/M40 family metallo-hydrolase n=1 Tax=Halobacterium litoreum TaxID=2039234 RepID=A0ABD5NCP1_9EURY|nr:M20/M25/M40 family metallo-hydrolase [Halobacterium litoreum]UHH14182.1 M20/M25/M40 family metallo-hydrolase [Halobacterium litoreum]